MLKDRVLWIELHPRERLTLFAIGLAVRDNGRKPVGIKALIRMTGTPRKLLLMDLTALSSWGMVTIYPSRRTAFSTVMLAGVAADSPLMPRNRI